MLPHLASSHATVVRQADRQMKIQASVIFFTILYLAVCKRFLTVLDVNIP